MSGLNYGNRYQLVKVKKIPTNNYDHSKPVVVYDLDWNKVDEHSSMKIAEEKLGITVKVIRYKILNKLPLNNTHYLGYKPQF